MAGQEGGQLPHCKQLWGAGGMAHPKNMLCHMQLGLCWGNPAAGAASVGPWIKHFGCGAVGDCEEQAELKTKPHQGAGTPTSPCWGQEGTASRCGVVGSKAFQSGRFGVLESGVLYKAPQGPDPLSWGIMECQGPWEWETWVVYKQNPIQLEGKCKLKNTWGKLIQNT